jgi:hypothetical protein
VIVLGDLNDRSEATTEILYGPPSSEIGTASFRQPDQSDKQRLWNLEAMIPASSTSAASTAAAGSSLITSGQPQTGRPVARRTNRLGSTTRIYQGPPRATPQRPRLRPRPSWQPSKSRERSGAVPLCRCCVRTPSRRQITIACEYWASITVRPRHNDQHRTNRRHDHRARDAGH